MGVQGDRRPWSTETSYSVTSHTVNTIDVILINSVYCVFSEQGSFNVEYFPLKAGTSQGKLEFTSNDLGLYLYDVELKALPSAPEKAVNFQTYLGNSQTLTAKFLNYAKHKTDYTCKVCCHVCQVPFTY